MPAPEWSKYGKSKTGLNCSVLDDVYHVAHVETALDIARKRQISPRLVQDESKLKQRRILVTWLSPNHWHPGFRYGNVSFAFDWETLIEGMNFYWVEVIGYNTPALRILVTPNDYTDDADFTPYDPAKDKGPWWFNAKENQHYFNGDYTLEIMVEDVLSLYRLKELKFVAHNSNHCSIHTNPRNCRELGAGAEKGGAFFLCGLINHELNCNHLKLTKPDTDKPTRSVVQAWEYLAERLLLAGKRCSGNIHETDAAAGALARALLGAIYRRNKTEVPQIAALFATSDDLYGACEALAVSTFGINPKDLRKIFKAATL